MMDKMQCKMVSAYRSIWVHLGGHAVYERWQSGDLSCYGCVRSRKRNEEFTLISCFVHISLNIGMALSLEALNHLQGLFRPCLRIGTRSYA